MKEQLLQQFLKKATGIVSFDAAQSLPNSEFLPKLFVLYLEAEF